VARADTGVSKELEEAVKELLKEAKAKDKEGNFKMAIEDRLGVVDRAMKLEALRHKIRDAGAGSGWDDPTGGEDGL
jgi:hypothetical protein